MDKVRPGQPLRISANQFNGFLKMWREWAADLGADGARPRAGRRRGILVRNDSGSDLGQFAILGVDGVAFDFDDNPTEFIAQPLFLGSLPSIDDHRGKFVVLAEAIESGVVGRAVLAGVTPVQVDVEDEDHEFADVADGVTANLASVPHGSARMVWREGGAGVQWALVLLGATLPPADAEHKILRWDDTAKAWTPDWLRFHET